MKTRAKLTLQSSYSEIVQRLTSLTTPLICDALPGVCLMDPSIEPIGENNQCIGRAYTVNSAQDSLSTMQALDDLPAFLGFLNECDAKTIPIVLTIASCGAPHALAGVCYGCQSKRV